MHLPIEKFNPVLLAGWRWTTYPMRGDNNLLEARRVHEYEIEFFTRSDGGVVIDGAFTRFARGDVNFRRPGQIVRGVLPYACLSLVVDLVGEARRPADFGHFGSESREAQRYENPLLDEVPNKLSMRDVMRVEQLMLNLTSAPSESEEQRFSSRILLMQLFQELFRNSRERPTACPPGVRAAYERLCREYARPPSVGELIEESGLSKAYFHACFREFAGCSPARLVTNLRMELARTMLADSRMAVADIAMWCGYDDPAYFARAFRARESLTPTRWREEQGR